MEHSRLSSAYPSQLAEAEARQIHRRRNAPGNRREGPAAASAPAADKEPPPGGLVGVALSGGGIRSATFCLGVFRALARQRRIGCIDFLSTVSGGGYFGSFLGGLFAPRPRQSPLPSVEDVSTTLLDLRSQPVDWLRENGRYMSPNGAGDTLLAGAVLLRNWVAVILVVSSFLFTLFAGTSWLAEKLQAWWGMARGSAWVADIDQAIPWTALSPEQARLLLSPYLALPLALLFLTVIPLGWAFWFTQDFGFSARSAKFPPSLFAVILAAAVWRSGSLWGQLLVFEGLAALACWLIAVWTVRGQGKPGERLMRSRLSRWLSANLWGAAALLLFALVDTLGRTLAGSSGRVSLWRMGLSAVAALLTAFTVVQKALPFLASWGGEKRLSPKPLLLAGIAALTVASGLLIGLSAIAHAIDPGQLGWVTACSVGVTLAAAWTVPFLNLSSHNSLYGARLTRAYLGASNQKRHLEHATVTELIPGDQIALADYDPPAAGGPLHLINVTLNETVSGKSQLEQRDRKGLAMAVGPCGISVGWRHHALWKEAERGRALVPVAAAEDPDRFQIFPVTGNAPVEVEELDLGAWVSISGAAFTTGLGARTSLALSLLLGLANVRLGHWWDCGISPSRRQGKRGSREALWACTGRWFSQLLPVHAYLLDELLARFHGPARRRWYLSDGGHFENTGGYELVRRRVPFIVMSDAGCDPGYVFADLANLARRVRLDFDAELAVFTREQLDQVLPGDLRAYFGTIEDFDPRRGGTKPHALLAGVFYEDPRRERPPGSVLVILKPSVSGDEPPDVVEYQKEHERFPQEPTADQFFDEAQWESYRRLGEHVASRVFEDVVGGWRPLDFCPPPSAGIRWRGASPALGGVSQTS